MVQQNRYQLYGKPVNWEDPEMEVILRRAYEASVRPLCLCRGKGVPMYLAQYAGKILVKRFPGTGQDHDPDCESYEPPPEVSGYSEVAGRAIKEDTEKGVTDLRLGFALKKGQGRTPVSSDEASTPGSVKSDGGRLSMLATLHYLWDQGGLNRWSPKMASKRNWFIIRKNLINAFAAKTAKGIDLTTRMYIPETWGEKDKEGLRLRRVNLFNAIAKSADKKQTPFVLMIGEMKSIQPLANSIRMVVKHVPDGNFTVPPDLYRKIKTNYSWVLSYAEEDQESHVMFIATLSVSPGGVTTVEEMALMPTSKDWIPVDSTHDALLVDRLVADERRFIKGLRYNLSKTAPMASAILTDMDPAYALYLVSGNLSDEEKKALDELQGQSRFIPWSWVVDSDEIPALPSLSGVDK